jgi:hypothetical protein
LSRHPWRGVPGGAAAFKRQGWGMIECGLTMNNETTFAVVTTLQSSSASLCGVAERVRDHDIRLLVVGDRNGPDFYTLSPSELLTLEDQARLPFRLGRILPEQHYARKNLGYLFAISSGCECIYETDHESVPLPHWSPRDRVVEGQRIAATAGSPWVNIYEPFTTEHVWPHGLPLSQTRRRFADDFEIIETPVTAAAPIQQGLTNGSPDVDAVWRLVLDQEIEFDDMPNLFIPRGVWSPFNGQNTWWWKEAFPLLYLPSFCASRLSEVWRSFVAQRCLWELDYEVEFHRADIRQIRNEQDLLRDFDNETVGYLRNDQIREILEACSLSNGPNQVKNNVYRCYERLVNASIFDADELDLVEAWLDDCSGHD